MCAIVCAETLKADTKWYNELGSVMTIRHVDVTSGYFSGTYHSAVGDKGVYDLQGQFNNEGFTLGWTVAYKRKPSTASWCGQIQMDSKTNAPVILTTWLLAIKTDPKKDWASTEVGFDTFTHDKPSEDTIHRAKLRCKQSQTQDD